MTCPDTIERAKRLLDPKDYGDDPMDDCYHVARAQLQLVADLQHWLGNILVINFLHFYRNKCFQMQGMYDGSISKECIESLQRDQCTTEMLLDMSNEEMCT
jgi:hypothetical protein